MDKKLKAKWVKALRSGKYKQGREYLYANFSYCCLGVLCRVAGLKKEQLHEHVLLGDVDMGKLLPSATMMKLTIMNDGEDSYGTGAHSFREIADYIEKRL